jgi:LmbE family N-acetylglucosaminyl deacetylase
MKKLVLESIGGTLAVVSPHDDDGIIGTGGLIHNLSQRKIKTYVLIMTDGSLGYSKIEQKNNIRQIRREEAKKAYKMLGAVPYFLDFPDMNLTEFKCWEKTDGKEGAYQKTLRMLRSLRPETVLLPNPLDWHPDHRAAFDIGYSIANLASTSAVIDFGEPIELRHIASYKVWNELNKVTHYFELSEETQKIKEKALLKFKSQADILKSVVIEFKKEYFEFLK